MKQLCEFILQFVILIQVFITLFILFSGVKSAEYAKLNVMVFIPLIVFLSFLPIEILEYTKKYIASKCIDLPKNETDIDNIIQNNANKYIIPYIHKIIYDRYYVNNINTFNPVNYQGILVLGFIINIYLLKYK